MSNDDNLNFNTIKPSAISVLEAKSYTSIPFTKEAFEILTLFKSNELERDIQLSKESFTISKFKETNKLNNKIQIPEEIILRIMNFKITYLSIDKGLKERDYNNILEIASGFSFRGLGFCKNPSIHYIDTDDRVIFRLFKPDQNGGRSQ